MDNINNYKTKIKFTSVDDIVAFVECLRVFESDVNVKYNSNTYDAKSIVALMCIPLNSIIDVELVSNDNCMKLAFHKYITDLNIREKDGTAYV